MTRMLALSALSVCMLANTTAFAQDDTTSPRTTSHHDPKRGIELGVRAGAGMGFGPVLFADRTNANVQHTKNGHAAFPVIVDLGYRITRYVYLGGFAEGAWISPKTGGDSFCPENSDCTAAHYAVGGMARYHFTPDARFDPSLGIGVGYQWLHESVTTGPVESSRTFRGLQWVTATFNGDFDMGSGFVLGPYATAALGQYTYYSAEVTGAGPLSSSRSGNVDDIGERRVHVWASIGLRGAFTAHL